MQNFLNFISIAAFIMSLTTWIMTAIQQSIRISVEVKDYSKPYGKIIQLYLYIQNNSKKPFTISGISLIHDKRKYPCKLLPSSIIEKGDIKIYTPLFPINFAAYQGVLLPFEFLDCSDIPLGPNKKIEIEICTNLKVIKRFLTLDQPDYLLRFRKK